MKKPIFLKIFAGYVLVVFSLAALIFAVSLGTIRTHHINQTKKNLSNLYLTIEQISKPLITEENIEGLDVLLKDLGNRLNTRITIINRQGVVLVDSEITPESMENHRNRPEVITALTGGTGANIRYSTTQRQKMLYVARPLEINGKIQAVIRLSLPLMEIDQLINTLGEHILSLTSVITIVSLIIALIFSHFISMPVRSLNKASKTIASGDFHVRVSAASNDEISELADSFNDMAEKIDASFSELSQKKEELEGIISSMNEGLMVLDNQGRILISNTSADRITGLETTRGRYYWEAFRSLQLNALLERPETSSITEELELDDRIYLLSITPLQSGRGNVLIMHDITGIRQIEKIKKDLVVNVSHELRTPLTAIKGYTETLIEDASGDNKEYLNIIHRHTDRLINIVNDLLDLSDLEERGRQPNLEDTDLISLTDKVLILFKKRLQEKGLALKTSYPHSPPVIRVDPFKIEQMLANLIDNAIKYTEKGSIEISIKTSEQDCIIEVKDTGIGIPKEHVSRIFERFYVADKSRSRSLGGTGLGLAIVKHIVSVHHGSISVESRPFIGTTFTIRLPF